MDIDIATQAGAVIRTVRNDERDGRPARTVVASRVYDTTVDDLWDAITSAERLPRWFLPVTGDLRVGGRYQLEGNAGGEVLACEPPRRLSVTWEFGGDVTWLDVTLTEEGDSARLVLEHTAHPGPHWDQFGPGAVGIGWDLALLGLGLHVASGEAVDPAAFQTWSASDAGKDFMRQSNDGWCAADIAGGTTAEVARAAADRTIEAYTAG